MHSINIEGCNLELIMVFLLYIFGLDFLEIVSIFRFHYPVFVHYMYVLNLYLFTKADCHVMIIIFSIHNYIGIYVYHSNSVYILY